MFNNNFENEIKYLFLKYSKSTYGFQAIGYHQFLNYYPNLWNNIDIKKIKENILLKTYHFAKYQINFLKKIKKFSHFINSENINMNKINFKIKNFLK